MLIAKALGGFFKGFLKACWLIVVSLLLAVVWVGSLLFLAGLGAIGVSYLVGGHEIAFLIGGMIGCAVWLTVASLWIT